MGKKEWDKKGDLKVSDYMVYERDDKGTYHQSPQSRSTAMRRAQAWCMGKSGSC